MSESRLPLSVRLAVPLVILATVGPLMIRFWDDIVPMVPIWARMLGQAALLVGVLIALAAVAAVVFVTWRRRRGSNA